MHDSRITLLLAAAFTTLTASACLQQDDEPGSVQVPLTSVDDEGNTYTLSGTLTFRGPRGSTVVDLAGTETQVVVDLLPGPYEVTLSTWALTSAGGPVEATLVSPNPVDVVVHPRGTAHVSYHFVTATSAIDFAVDDQAIWFAGSFVPGMQWDESLPYVPAEGPLATAGDEGIDFMILFDNLSFSHESTGSRTWIARGVKVELLGGPDLDGIMTGLDNEDAVITTTADGAGGTAIQIDIPEDGSELQIRDETAYLLLDAEGLPLLQFVGTEVLNRSDAMMRLSDFEGDYAEGRAAFRMYELYDAPPEEPPVE